MADDELEDLAASMGLPLEDVHRMVSEAVAGFEGPPDPRPEGGSIPDLMLLGRVDAGIMALGRAGATDFELAYDDEAVGPEPVWWVASARWKGARVISRQFCFPAQAVEDLMSRALDGGTCLRCRRTTVTGLVEAGTRYCCLQLVAMDLEDASSYRYVRSCEDPVLVPDAPAPVLAEGSVVDVAGELYRVVDHRLPGLASDKVGKLYLRRAAVPGG